MVCLWSLDYERLQLLSWVLSLTSHLGEASSGAAYGNTQKQGGTDAFFQHSHCCAGKDAADPVKPVIPAAPVGLA